MPHLLTELSHPSVESMSRASGIAKGAAENWPRYLRGCQRSFTVIEETLREVSNRPVRGARVLDWGSSIGGVSILMKQAGAARVVASDVDAHALNWLAETCPDVETAKLEPDEPLPLPDRSFDIIYGISILTHIPAEMQDFYISELSRVLSDTGTLILTVASYAALEMTSKDGRDPRLYPKDNAELDRVGVFFASYPDTLLAKMDFAEKAPYGAVFHSRDAITELFSKRFRILSACEWKIGVQEVIVLERYK